MSRGRNREVGNHLERDKNRRKREYVGVLVDIMLQLVRTRLSKSVIYTRIVVLGLVLPQAKDVTKLRFLT